ncbi:uncharacterized protein [Periplaneta americana]|uniref:uncharacterized protein isoform X3 n=1 Tax=Periplaneta americana TaxID=6978 RepID=UPI0037E7FC13
MDVIKMEPDINPLPLESNDTEEKKSLSEEGNLLDLPVTRIKEDCVDDSYIHTEIKFEENILPITFPVVKCEAEEVSFVVSTLKEESLLEVSTEESGVLTERNQLHVKTPSNLVFLKLVGSAFVMCSAYVEVELRKVSYVAAPGLKAGCHILHEEDDGSQMRS